MMKCGLLIAAGAFLAMSPFDVVARTWDQLPNFDHVENTFAKHPCRQVLVTGLRVGKMHIAFETTSWSDLQRQLGALKLRRQGDGAETVHWTCFTVGSAHERVQIWLDGSELAGDELIDGVTAVAGTPWPLKECPKVNPGPGPIELDNGLWIGTRRTSLIKLIGPPTATQANSLIYDYSAPAHDRQLGDGATVGRILLGTKADRVVRIRANKDTSY